MEATGSYNLALAMFLVEHERTVRVVNPFYTHHAALAQTFVRHCLRGSRRCELHSLIGYTEIERLLRGKGA